MNECHPCIRSILLPIYPLDKRSSNLGGGGQRALNLAHHPIKISQRPIHINHIGQHPWTPTPDPSPHGAKGFTHLKNRLFFKGLSRHPLWAITSCHIRSK